jgi:hypothetical protein
MIFKKSGLVLLPALAVLASHVYAQDDDLPAMDNYTPPAQLFDAKPVKVENAEAPPMDAPMLTAVTPEAEKTEDAPPTPPKKPKPPAKLKKKEPQTASNGLIRRPANKPVEIFTANQPPKVKTPPKPIVTEVARPSKTQLEDGGHLANPNVKDVLASIEGVKAPAQTGSNKISLTFLPGETVLTLDMKNTLLQDYMPQAMDANKRVEILAFASPDKSGESGSRRISLARAQETRDFLTAAGVDPKRIDIMPLGNDGKNPGSDRVDILTVSR